MITYIRNKQIRVVNAISLDFIREKYIKKLTSKNRLVGLIGQRGVGKTTLLLQYLKQNYKLSVKCRAKILHKCKVKMYR